jgi:hypothetical protein
VKEREVLCDEAAPCERYAAHADQSASRHPSEEVVIRWSRVVRSGCVGPATFMSFMDRGPPAPRMCSSKACVAKSNAELAVRLSAGSLIASEERTFRHRQCVLDDAGNSPDRFALPLIPSRPASNWVTWWTRARLEASAVPGHLRADV